MISELPSLYLSASPKNLLSPNFLSAPRVKPLVFRSFAYAEPFLSKILKDISAKLQLDHFDFLFSVLCLLMKDVTLFLIDGSNLLANDYNKGSS